MKKVLADEHDLRVEFDKRIEWGAGSPPISFSLVHQHGTRKWVAKCCQIMLFLIAMVRRYAMMTFHEVLQIQCESEGAGKIRGGRALANLTWQPTGYVAVGKVDAFLRSSCICSFLCMVVPFRYTCISCGGGREDAHGISC